MVKDNDKLIMDSSLYVLSCNIQTLLIYAPLKGDENGDLSSLLSVLDSEITNLENEPTSLPLKYCKIFVQFSKRSSLYYMQRVCCKTHTSKQAALEIKLIRRSRQSLKLRYGVEVLIFLSLQIVMIRLCAVIRIQTIRRDIFFTVLWRTESTLSYLVCWQ